MVSKQLVLGKRISQAKLRVPPLTPVSLFNTETPTGFEKKFLKKFSWKITIFGSAINPVFLNNSDARRRPVGRPCGGSMTRFQPRKSICPAVPRKRP
jgi:hypothetical protein